MSQRRVFRRIILPSAWLIIGALIAVSLVKLAFSGSSTAADDQLYPTGEIPAETVMVEKDTINNSLSLPGTINLVEAKPITAPSAGVVNWMFVKVGDNVSQGDKIFQIRVESSTEPALNEDASSADEQSEDTQDSSIPAEAQTTVTYHDVYASATGKVGKFNFEIGDDVTKGENLATVQPQSFQAVATIKALDRYRLMDETLEATISIENGPEPFTCKNLTVGDTASQASTTDSADSDTTEQVEGPGTGLQNESAAGSEVTCDVPTDVVVFDGLDMNMDVDAGSAEDVLTVPVTSVRGLVDKGAVWILNENGKEIRTEVELGVTDGKVIEVRKGLSTNDDVLRYVPGSAPAPGMEDGMEIYP